LVTFPVIVAVQVVDPPIVNVAGIHDTAIVVGSWTVTVVFPLALAYVPSLAYAAVIVGVPTALSVYVTEHLSNSRKHTAPMNEPVDGSEVLNDTMSPLVTFPVIVAVQVVDPPIVNVAGIHDTAIVVGTFWTVTVVVPVALAYVPLVVYLAVIVAMPSVVSVYVTEHVSDARMHVPVNEPVIVVVVRDTFSLSGTLPVIVAVQFVDPPIVNVEGVHDTANVVVVAACAKLSIANSAMMAVINKDVPLFLIFPLSSFLSIKER
jgi:hypothetical protein